MKMKKSGLTFLLLLLSGLNVQALEENALLIELQNGQKATFVLSKKPEMTFSNHVLQIGMNGKNTSFELDDVKQFFFVDTSTGISTPKTDEMKIVYQSDDKILIEGIGENDHIRVFSIDGTQYAGRIEKEGGKAEILLTSLPKGTYIISISNKQTFKINRK